MLRRGGLLHLAVAEGDGEGWQSDQYDGQPRWFAHHREAPLAALLWADGFTVFNAGRAIGTGW